MGKYRKIKPKLSAKEVMNEIHRRTGYDAIAIGQILVALVDIIKEGLVSGVEVEIAGVGKFGFSDYVPMKDVDVFSAAKKEWVHYDYTNGYRKPVFRFCRRFRDSMRELTTKTYQEVFGEEDGDETMETSDS